VSRQAQGRRRGWLLGTVLLVSGCGGLSKTPRPAHVYDLGLGQPVALEVGSGGGLVGAVQVVAPSWLRSGAMQYRLTHDSPGERHSYRDSRWAAPPAELVHGFLNRALGGEGGCRLEVEVDEFIQDFPSAGHSDGLIEARARLRVAQEGAVLASRSFSLRVPATRSDAPGGVAALGRGTRQLAAELGAWLAALSGSLGSKLHEVCARR